MFRQFGFIANKKTGLNKPLEIIRQPILTSFNTDKKFQPAGWGFGFYQSGSAFLLKNKKEPVTDEIFDNLSNSVSSKIFMAHVLPPGIDISKDVDCQPFRKGSWLFVHNGLLGCTKKTKSRIKKNINMSLVNSISGSTGSEYLFHLFLSHLRGKGGIRKGEISFEDTVNTVNHTIKKVKEIHEEIKCTETNVLNFLISNGSYLLAYREGPEIFYSTFAYSENYPIKSDYTAGVISSEKYDEISEWKSIPEKCYLIIDENIDFHIIENQNL